jgi:hypothetical protein
MSVSDKQANMAIRVVTAASDVRFRQTDKQANRAIRLTKAASDVR